MQAKNGTSPDSTRFFNFLRLLVSLIIIVLAQGFITLIIGGGSSFILLFSSHYFWGDLAHVYPPDKLLWIGVNFLMAGGAFSLPWLGALVDAVRIV